MQFFNVEIPDELIPDDTCYITIDADGELCAWTERPERDDVYWYTKKVGPVLGFSDDLREWDSHWYTKLEDGQWYYGCAEPQRPTDDFHWDTATQYAEGRKDDAAKLRYDLLPPHALEQLTAVLTYGAEKYGANNWKRVAHAEDRYYAAALRHLQAWRQGELLDPESDLPHLAHAMCSLVFLLENGND